MKKIIIVLNNMKVGGVQKSLYNLLWTIEKQYDITLLLFGKTGEYVEQLPPSVKVLECDGPFRYFGLSQSECKAHFPDFVKRGFFAAVSKFFGRHTAVRLMLKGQPVLPEHYDCAISYLHNGRREAFYGGTQDFVLNCINADKKVAFLHCDYANCGANHPENNGSMEHFDAIAACSDGCRRVFESALPHLKEKTVTVRNCHRLEEIRAMAAQDPVGYDKSRCNVVMVARLSHEKGVERAIEAAADALGQNLPISLHIVGDGGMREELQTLARARGIAEQVHFYGEQSNPYRYMKNADLFLLTSYHEAAPMVIEEAEVLGLPVLTTRTTSSEDMVIRRECGWVCENTQEAINQTLTETASDPDALQRFADSLQKRSLLRDNGEAIRSFAALVEC